MTVIGRGFEAGAGRGRSNCMGGTMRRILSILGLLMACLFIPSVVFAPAAFAADPGVAGSCTLATSLSDVAVAGHYVYVTDSVGLQIVDVSAPNVPTMVGSRSLPSARGIAVVGAYAYVTDASAGLQVIDVSMPSSPTIVGSCALSMWAGRISVTGGYVYVTCEFDGLQVIDVRDPTKPAVVGSTLAGSANAVAAVGDYAYVTDGGLHVVDVSDRTSPAVVGTCTLPSWVEGGVAVASGRAYVSDGYGGLVVVDVGVATAPAVLGSCIPPYMTRDVAVAGGLAYVADGWGGLQVVDVSTPTAPVITGACVLDGEATGVDVAGRYAYVIAGAGLYVVDLTPPLLTGLTPDHGLPGATITISGSGLGSSGVVKFGDTAAATSAWSTTSITCTVPGGLGQGPTTVTVAPTGGATSNALPFEVDGTTAQLRGHVYALLADREGGTWNLWLSPASGAIVRWGMSSSTQHGSTTTGSDGAYTLNGVPPATGDGVVQADFPRDSENAWKYSLAYTGRSWLDRLISTFDFRPGMATMRVTGGGPWFDDMNDPWVTMRGTDADGGVESSTIRPNVTFDRAFGLPGAYTAVCAYWYSNEGVEKAADFTVAAGQETTTSLAFNETNAQRLWETYNFTASGDPGSVVKLRLQNYPAGQVTDFYGYQYEPVTTPLKSFGAYTAKPLANQYKSVTIPSTAVPGQDYVIGGQHRAGLLDLEVYFQVTRLKAPSSASGSYKLTGRVPIQGYTGAPTDTGTRKYVSVYRRFAVAGQPKGNPIKYGWTLVGKYQTSATGTFTTRSMNPGRTAWYVVFYPGDKDNWAGFTSVRRVRHF